LAERADRFEMLAVRIDTVVAFSVAIFEIVWYDWNAFKVVIFALRTPRVLTLPVWVLDVVIFAWIRFDRTDIKLVIFETATFPMRASRFVTLPVAMFISPDTFESLTFDLTAIILSAKVTSPISATNELSAFKVPSTVSLPRFVFAVPIATFAKR
jgi:hypothetical protein